MDDLHKRLLAMDMPAIYVPSPDDFHQVDELPALGTGKLDLKGIKQKALEIKGIAEPT